LWARGRHTQAVTDNYIYANFNGDVGANYDYQHTLIVAAATSFAATYTDTKARIGEFVGTTATRTTMAGLVIVDFPFYTDTKYEKGWFGRSSMVSGTGGGFTTTQFEGGQWRNTSPIMQIDITPTANELDAGAIFSLYGMK
jgi:hypothetical protein